MRAFARAIVDLRGYIPGPDMGTDEMCMAWVHDEIGRAVGLPSVLGGIPLDEIGATGYGLAASAEGVAATGRLQIDGARVVVQGFGAVGRNVARFLVERGAVLVAAADRRGGVADPSGLDVCRLSELTAGGGSVVDYAEGRRVTPEELVGLDCDVWIPAARPDVFNETNAWDVKAAVILQGANIPATAGAERVFHDRGVLSVPDFIANAGGVICAAVEYRGGSTKDALAQIHGTVAANTEAVVREAGRLGVPVRQVAQQMAWQRLGAAEACRRRF
jgi:glutamate dehydrogenase/leucine dehydrogenase